MEKIAIIGAGGFGREVKMLLDQINKINPMYEIVGFYDDDTSLPKMINGLPYLGSLDDLLKSNESISLALGIGIPEVKSKIVDRLKNKVFKYPTLIHPSVLIGEDEVKIGQGTIICAGTIITCNINIGAFVTLNLCCTVGHDTTIKDFASCMPSVNISGEVEIMEKVYVGTGAKIINQLQIGENTVIGAGAVVSKSLPANCTAVGMPAKPIKFNNQ
ncbi:MAG: acetyltransferase [Bacteroidetes bacterium HGW-Bacteroidetes-2]|jgi:sugar O-acyltransferase (sialic acid O-acetyltransferase NeuD family)|nr:MAG: acetyltransferase [Bacteroidetes bacterium HGW-Bacteroidetes-2]